MRRLRLLCALALAFLCGTAWASEPLVYVGNALYTSHLVGKNQNYYQQTLKSQPFYYKKLNIMKGDIGEGVMHTMLTDRHLGGSWVQTNPKFAQPGRQGFDATYVKYKDGHPTDLFIGEAKYNTATLIKTQDGYEMSQAWVHKRLTTQVNAFGKAANAVHRGNFTYTSSGSNGENAMTLRAFDASGKSRKISVWWDKKNGREVLNVDTNGRDIPKENVRSALKEVQKLYRDNLTALNRGEPAYRGRIYKNIQYDGKNVTYDIVDVTGNRETRHVDTRTMSESQRARVVKTVNKRIDSYLKSKNISASDTRRLKKMLDGNMTLDEAFAAMNRRAAHIAFAKHTAWNAATAGAKSVIYNIVDQLWHNGRVDWGQTVKIAAFTTASSAVGQYAGHYALNSAVGQRAINKAAKLLHVGSGAVAEVGGGIVTSLIGAYGSYALGQIDLATANRMAATSTVAVIGSKAAIAGVTWAVASYGAAGTGTAIATLHGAVAAKATLAAIGTLGHTAVGTSIAGALGGLGISASVIGGGVILPLIGYGAYKLIDWMLSPSEEELRAQALAEQERQRLAIARAQEERRRAIARAEEEQRRAFERERLRCLEMARELMRGHLQIARAGI